ncbi:MAG: divalent-cation tolerance protein CutA [Polyangiaceae bacterium]|nr:divalent-cation tolerance protein CutA [Polyangiaceae bacterium]
MVDLGVEALLADDLPYRLVYVTTSDREEALRIGRTVVERRLAACVNVFDGMGSIYWWKGAIETGSEAVLLAKTTTPCVAELVATIRSLHSYECPCVVALPVVGGNPAFLAWIEGEVAAPADPL